MRLTKKNQNVNREKIVRSKKDNTSRDLEDFNHSNQINDIGAVYLQKILKTNEDYKAINTKMKIDTKNLINCDENIQNIFSSDEKRQKAIRYIINSLNDKNKEKFKKIKLNRNNYNSYNNNRYFSTEQENDNDMDINKNKNPNYINEIKDINENYKIETPKRKNENYNSINENIYNNNSRKFNINNSKNNIYTPKKKKEYLIYNDENEINEKNDIAQNPFNNLEENNSKFYDKNNIINNKKELFKKLNLININDHENRNLFNGNQSINNKNFLKRIKSPKASTTKRQFSPFKDILSKSSNNFFIHKIPINNNNLSIRNFNNKNLLTKEISDKEQSSIYRYKKNNTIINSSNPNKSYLKINNSFLNNNSLIYRNKKAINQKIYESNSLKNNKSIRNKYKKNYISIHSKNINDKNDIESGNENDEKKNNNLKINENEKKGGKINDIPIKKEELKKYLNYFIKDITPININQFVIYSHSNNNSKNEDEIFSINKNCLSSKNKNNIYNNTYMNGFNNIKIKENYFDLNNNSTTNKILVKKRPLNENINPNQNDNNNNNNYSGFSICKYIKGESILNLPINANNLYMINQFLKESGFEIREIKQNKKSTKENTNTNQKKEIKLTNLKNDSNKKKAHTIIEIRKLSNKKDNSKIIGSGLNTSRNKTKNSNKKKIKNTPNKLNDKLFNSKEKNDKIFNSKEKKNLKTIFDKNKFKEKIVVKLKENFEEFEKTYINKNKENKYNLGNILNEDEICQRIRVSTPNFKSDDNSKK